MDDHNQIARIVVEGSLCRDMYDEHPGFAYFYLDAQRDVPIPHALPLTTSKLIAEREWVRHHPPVADGDDDAWEEYDGMFTATRILLLARDASPVQCYERGEWKRDFPAPAEWESMLNRATDLSSEASVEAGWDNFSTAENLRRTATALRRSVAMARAQANAQAAEESIRGMNARVLAAHARIAAVAGAKDARLLWRQAERAAHAVGIHDQLTGGAKPPAMFKGERVLIAQWQSGCAWARKFEEGLAVERD
ncbi:hypothetical protein AB4Y45_32875 [Paraburkholderia sp. EG287A]|uniref:hypothetical protein n=1 Tax=Paraburkholderia sp. EG287A TaxID=3237012 RepID=UPI0034D1E8F5